MKDKPIFVTQPSLPPLEEFYKSLKIIWESKWLTNNGPFHQQLEKELCKFLGVKHISLFSNGTLALITALQALQIKGEVITTPYSFVATTNALWWNNIKPVFVDIEPQTFNIDASKIVEAITNKTTAILPVHVYGNPCNIKKINAIAKKYNLKVIYDAAHSFGVTLKDKSVLNFGDLSILSFHATKVFNTFEGGAIICHDKKMKQHIDDLKNFGFRDEITVVTPGINAKMNEFQAALGLLQLKHLKKEILKRKIIAEIYYNELKDIKGINISLPSKDISYNYSYFPILIDTTLFGKSRDDLYTFMRTNNIFCRKYFYPLISDFSTYKELDSSSSSNLPIATEVSKRVLCLPIYPDLEIDEVSRIANLIKLKS